MEMKRTKYPSSMKMQAYSVALQRLTFANALGRDYKGARDLYDVLGYSKDLLFQDYYVRYKRNGLGAAVINRPVDTTWRGDVKLVVDESTETQLEKAWETLYDALSLKSIFHRADKLAAIGHYSVILMGFNDTTTADMFAQPATGTKKLVYVKPFSEYQATVVNYETNPMSERFGKPKTYTIKVNDSTTIQVDHTRIIHITGPILDDETKGIPMMEKVFNHIADAEKVTGGSGEMFWRGARPGYQGVLKDDYTATPQTEKDLQDQIAEYENNLRRILMNEGYEIKALASQVSDPTNHVNVQVDMISAGSHIPKRILLGSERGELASTQDEKNWYTYVQGRRNEYAEPHILNLFVDKCQEHKILPATPAGKKYTWQWEDLMSSSDKDRAEVGKLRSESLSKYSSTIGAQDLIPQEIFFKHFLGLSDTETEIVLQAMEELAMRAPVEDTPLTEEEEEIINEEEITEE